MSHEEDCCFQCQESGHIAHHCPNVQCFECDEYRHIVMDCPQRIPPSGTPIHCQRLQSQHRHPIDLPHATVIETGTIAVDPDHNHIIKDTTAKVTISPIEAILGHSTGTVDDITGVIHDTHTQMLISTVLAVILYREGHLYTEAHQLTHEITADHTLDQPTGQLKGHCIRLHHIPEAPKIIHTLDEIQEIIHNWTFTVQMTIPVVQKKTPTI